MAQAGMDPTAHSYIHLVDGEGNFGCKEEELASLIERSSLSVDGKYSIVGIMGCQSSGKSTLLNLLFGTKFEMMDGKTGRSQTTKGIWLDAGAGRHDQNLLIMDLEGTDSNERGEDRTTFERQTILYGLALAEVLMINMWEHDIGRYTASNYGILKTVMEVNLSLFQSSKPTKTQLLFVVRDHIEEDTPFSEIQVKLSDDVGKIWAELRKPEQFAETKLEDLFDLQYVGLPHMKLQKAEFAAAVDDLRARFLDKTHARNLLATDYHGSKAVPMDGFAHYCGDMWETIRSNKDIDMPTQRSMLAAYRCDEIAAEAMATLTEQAQPLLEAARGGRVPDFGSQVDALVEAALGSYDSVAARYESEIVARKRAELLARVVELLQEGVDSHLAHAAKDAQQGLEQVLAALPKAAVADDFTGTAEAAKADAMQALEAALAQCSAQEPGLKWDASSARELLADALSRTVEEARKGQLQLLERTVEKLFKDEYVPQATRILKEAEPDTWPKLRTQHARALEAAGNHVGAACASLGCDEAEQAAVQEAAASKAEKELRELVRQHSGFVHLTMRNKFNNLFRRTPDGQRRLWKPRDDVQTHFKACREAALGVLDIFSRFRLQGDNEAEEEEKHGEAGGEEQVILSDGQVSEAQSHFAAEVEGALRDAELEQERAAQQSAVPMWLVLLILLLGWNEFMAALRNPLLVFLMLALAGAAYVVNQLKMWPVVFGMVRSGLSQAIVQVAGEQGPHVNVPYVGMVGPGCGGAPGTAPAEAAGAGADAGAASGEAEAPTQRRGGKKDE